VSTGGVSIIIPSYENWPLLERTIAAVLFDCKTMGGQSEIIVVDNESSVWVAQRAAAIAPEVRVIRRSGLNSRHFQPGAARNAGVAAAKHDVLIFLDADCIPSPPLVHRYRELANERHHTVFLGHRVFIDANGFEADLVAERRSLLEQAKRVASASNYRREVDRRLDELRTLNTQAHAYDCLHACNFALHRECLGDLRFASVFDGFWGYEDIELGYRLHKAGRVFEYVPEAFVYHQEGDSTLDRLHDRERNFAIAASLIPGFLAHRMGSPRIEPVPAGVLAQHDSE
jgi:glycosyltransferase involved in cell wall biosynthesis